MSRSTVHYADAKTNRILKTLHKKLRPAGTPVQRVEYIIELLLLRIFEVKLKRDNEFKDIRKLFIGENETKLFYYLQTIDSKTITEELNQNFFPFYGNIINEARKVVKGNMSIKVQDQLVLIQEVFRNSNFTNNVQSGNLSEIISAVADLDEDRLLNTDLLGDAIESALSETGGTKEIGLFRTPDHVRQFMVGLVEPTIKDSVFDPACGTGGFLFDSFEFVMEGITQENNWPGNRTHTEIQKWFKDYFKQNKFDMPSMDESTRFYRSGVFGIEYLGMIRKMAAVNFYIRGLNPNNIQQGDSLAQFDHTIEKSKSAILANPPFGAERDQEAYPNVWEEYSRESETTILFVKMMLNSLRDGGKCAVVVSEGFLTWDQGSAKALRNILLDEAKLIGVIGLPQGVFVSKNGPGPKTSVLFFEKGKKTDNVWMYQVLNDGYSMGTNRSEIKGCQLIDALNIYHNYIKKGLTPPETKNSFMISVDWIKSLDPRIKDNIRNETTASFTEKKDKEEITLVKKLKKDLKDKKINQKEYDQKIWQFNTAWDSRIQNEIAKRIDKAHSYSYNSVSYRSNLAKSQLNEWNTLIENHQPKPNGKNLDQKYEHLKNADIKNIKEILSHFDLKNAVEADIVRDYVSKFSESELKKTTFLKKIDEIFKSGAKYPMVKLGDYLIERTEKVKPQNDPDKNWKVLGVSNEIGIFLNKDATPEETNQTYYIVTKNDFCYNPYRINVGSIGLTESDYDNQIISGAYIVFTTKENELNPQYLNALFQHDNFKKFVVQRANVGSGVRMNFTYEDMCNFEIPLPPMNIQEEFIKKINSKNSLIEAANIILNNWTIDKKIFKNYKTKFLNEIAYIIMGQSPKSEFYNTNKDGKLFYQGKIDFGEFEIEESQTYTSDIKKISRKDDILISVRAPVGPVNLNNLGEICIGRGLAAIRKYNKEMLNDFLFLYLKSIENDYNANVGAVFDSINKDFLENMKIPFPDLNIQKELISLLRKDIDYYLSTKNLRIRMNKEILLLIDEIYGINN